MALVKIPSEGRTLDGEDAIRTHLGGCGIEYARVPEAVVPSDVPAEALLARLSPLIDDLKARGGYVTADVIDVSPATPGLDAMLARFNTEHWHDEDEVRLIVEGRGLFHVHPPGEPVFAIEVAAGVPATLLRSCVYQADGTARARVTLDLSARGLDAVVLDIEGTTTPLAFVHQTLSPFARGASASCFREQVGRPETPHIFSSLRADWLADVARGESPPAWPDQGSDEQQVSAIAAYAAWLMDRDRKAFGLKELQGRIWERGYRDGSLRGEVYPAVPAALGRWREGGATVAKIG